MGSYTFTWEHGGDEVVVTGTFDAWKQTVKLEKQDGVFKKTVEIPKSGHQYKFIVDGVWKHNDAAPKEDDGNGGYNNVLGPDDIQEPVTTLSSAAPDSTTAALAGSVPKEGAKGEEGVPGAFPETPFETPATEPQTFSVNPIPATEGPGNPIQLAPGEKVPDPSSLTSNTVQSTVKDDKEPEEATMSVNPIPASAGPGNPVQLPPGEKVPDPSTFTSNTIQSTAKTDAESYEKPDTLPPQLGPVVAPEAEREAKGGMFNLPPVTGSLIPESSLPKETETKTEQDPGITIQSAAPTSTTAALAGQVPKEPKDVPDAVTASQKEADFPPEASANPVAVEEKKEVEEELKEKVPEEPVASPKSDPKLEETGATAATGATATAATFAAATYSAKDKAAAALGLNGQPTQSEVPEAVTESQKEAHASPEAAANPEAVEEKKEVEAELLKQVKPTNEAGEPAPTVTAATTETAPGLSDDALVDTKPLKSSSEPDALKEPASEPAQPETSQHAVDSRDISPMSKQPTTTQQMQPTVTTGVETSKTESKTAPETPKNDAAEPSKGTPDSVASGATDKKKKRRSIFGKIKDAFKH